MRIPTITLMLFVLFLLIGCETSTKLNDETNTTLLKENNKTKIVTLAKVNDHIITTQVLGNKSNLFFALNAKGKKQMIEKLINDELLIQEALSENNETNISDENFRAKRGLVLVEAKSLSKTLKEINEENISSVYEKNKQKYFHRELFEASNILVDKEEDAIEIINQLEKTDDFNTTFVKIAKEKSVGKASKVGGYLGFFEKKVMVKPIQKALEALKENTFTKKPIKTSYGYHIVYLHSSKPEGYLSLDEVKRDIILEINRKNMDKWAYNKLETLKKEATIEILFDLKED